MACDKQKKWFTQNPTKLKLSSLRIYVVCEKKKKSQPVSARIIYASIRALLNFITKLLYKRLILMRKRHQERERWDSKQSLTIVIF